MQEVRIPSGTDELQAVLARPHAPRGLVLFAHGSGSGRHSPRNRQVAHQLQQLGLATLLLDLLTLQEEAADQRTAKHRFDIPMLTQRFEDASAWAAAQPALRDLPIGYFGASTGSAVALSAASRQPGHVAAVVSRGGRPDLAGDAALQAVRAPTLLIVGGEDGVVLDLNRSALAQLRCERQLEVIPGATHLFEEPGALEQVAELARTWLHNHLARPTPG
ncbi:MAG TPA: alpha/beta family hydrolase [Burkholderiaceae bacterium]|nr:alpha/beta family hydrolase [Burkholderiaceae bacterium]